MENRIEVSSLFYKGKLFQLGDEVRGKSEYLDNRYGFTKYDIGGVITKIIIETDVVCNSLYLNEGITYNTIGGLGFKFELDYKEVSYVFECCDFITLHSIKEQRDYMSRYFFQPVNEDKLENILSILKNQIGLEPNKRELERLGNYIYKNHRMYFD
jgi:hypothetical protein